jgi:hypothetical protein
MRERLFSTVEAWTGRSGELRAGGLSVPGAKAQPVWLVNLDRVQMKMGTLKTGAKDFVT